jgi:hypothetical protein
MGTTDAKWWEKLTWAFGSTGELKGMNKRVPYIIKKSGFW